MVFKLPGLLKSPAFQAGAFKAINTRFDQASENMDKYRLAAQKSGAKLFEEHKVTANKLKVESQAKNYIASQFSPAMANYLDASDIIDFAVGEDPKDFFALLDQKAAEVQQAGGVPETFQENQNMYIGDQRYEEYETSYNKVKQFMDKNNAIFGNSFSLLMEEQAPSLMTQEQFGVKSIEDITSLNRSGAGPVEVDSVVENRLVRQVSEVYAPASGVIRFGSDGQQYTQITDDTERLGVSVANVLSNINYRFDSENREQGIGYSARQGVNVAKGILGFANTTETKDSAITDLADISYTLQTQIAGFGSNEAETINALQASFGLYLYAVGQQTNNPGLVRELTQHIQEQYGVNMVPIQGMGA